MPKIVLVPSSIAGISIIPGGSSEFNELLRSITDPDSVMTLEAIAPYCVMLRNDTGESLFAVTVRTYLISENGQTIVHQMTHGTRSNTPWNLIAPGETVLMTPETGLNTKIRRDVQMNIRESSRLSARLVKDKALYSAQKEVRITVDSVVFEDGSVSGPDHRHLLEELNAWADADNEVIDEVLARSGPELKRYLTSLSEQYPEDEQSNNKFLRRRQEFANDLLMQLGGAASESLFLDSIRSRRSSRLPHLWRRSK